MSQVSILVTGARGFIGSTLTPRLEASGFSVVTLNRSAALSLNGTDWTADLTDALHCSELKRRGSFPDVVVHLAGRVQINLRPDPAGFPAPVPDSQRGMAETYATNVLGTARLAEVCLEQGVRHFIFASSQTVYGYPTVDELTEETICQPLEHYAVSKYCAERLLERAACGGMAVTALRIPGVFSERRNTGVVYRFCADAVTTGSIKVQSTIALPIDVIHVDDVVDAMVRAVSLRPERWCVLNIATGEQCSLDLLAQEVASLVTGCQVVDHSVPQPRFALSCMRAHRWLGWQAQPRRERLRQMVEFIGRGGIGACR